MRNRILTLVAAVLLAGCGELGATNCTTEARASVSITVNELGPNGTVRYSLDGAPLVDAECFGPEQQACTSWVAGWERAGTYRIVATSADGARRAEQTVVVTKGECHVDGQQLTLTLLGQASYENNSETDLPSWMRVIAVASSEAIESVTILSD